VGSFLKRLAYDWYELACRAWPLSPLSGLNEEAISIPGFLSAAARQNGDAPRVTRGHCLPTGFAGLIDEAAVGHTGFRRKPKRVRRNQKTLISRLSRGAFQLAFECNLVLVLFMTVPNGAKVRCRAYLRNGARIGSNYSCAKVLSAWL